LTFQLYTADDYDRTTGRPTSTRPPSWPSKETERRPAFGGWHQVAVITLATGDKYTVEDGVRQVAKLIAEAQQAAAAALAET
jgi:hypothetical protein